jgi:hypothetical protein
VNSLRTGKTAFFWFNITSQERKMECVSIMNKKTCFTAMAVLAFGLATAVNAQGSSMSIGTTGGASTDKGASNGKADQKDMGTSKKRDGQGGYSMKDNPTRGGTEKSIGSSKPGSSGSGAAAGSSRPMKPEGSGAGRSTGDKGFSNLREDKGGKGSGAMLGGSTDTKPGHAGESIGSGGTGKGDKSNLDAGAPADGSSPGIAK